MSRSFVNIIVISLTLAITYASIVAGSSSDNIFPTNNRANDTAQAEYYFESKANLCFIQRTQETLHTVIENIYSFTYKKILSITLERIQAYEQKLISSSIAHIEFRSSIELNCTTRQLIYPFNYFW